MRLGLLLALLGVAVAAPARSAESFPLEFFTAGDHLFEDDAEPTATPPRGKVLAVGRCEGGDFAVEGIANVELLDPRGKALRLFVEAGRIYRDPVADNKIVSLRLYFLADPRDLAGPAEGFRVRWGPEVKADNLKVDSIVLDRKLRESYREFRRSAAAADPSSGQSSSIIVIAESKADYYFLWYLVPMAAIFALLTIRKIFANGNAGGEEEPGAPVSRTRH